jgi:hypothetical protein
MPKDKWNINKDIEDILDIPFERARDWVNRKFIKPDYIAAGKGTKNQLSIKNFYQIKTFDYLVRNNIAREHAKKAMEQWGFTRKTPYLHILKNGDDILIEWRGSIRREFGKYTMLIVVDVRQVLVEGINWRALPVKVKTLDNV